MYLFFNFKWLFNICDPGMEHKTSLKSLEYICSNSQQYIVWVKIIHFSFMPKNIRTTSRCQQVTHKWVIAIEQNHLNG